MDIFIQSDIYIRMAKHFADTLDISPIADTVCRKCMAQCVKVRLLYICFIQIRIKLILVSTWFHRGKFIQHITPPHPYKREEVEREIPESGSHGQSRAFWAILHTESFSDPPARPEFFGQSC